MMAENPKYWWSLNGSSSSLPLNTSDDHNHHNQDLPLPWSQLLLVASDRVKQETNFIRQSSWHHNQQFMYNTITTIGHGDNDDNDNDKVEGGGRRPCWMMPVLVSSMSPTYSYSRRSSSCNTNLSSSSTSTTNIYLDFSTNQLHNQHPILDHHLSISHLQCSDTSATSGASKKARVQPSSRTSTMHPPLKVRKEKLGDRITALHQLVSPFGKTDTASVLLEAIGYIRFLEAQIQALSSPYLGNVSSGSMRILQSATDSAPKDLRSKGLCLVPVDCAHHINTTNGTDNINVPDYWASSALGARGF